MQNDQSTADRSVPWLKWLLIGLLVSTWAAGTLYLDYYLFPYIHDFDSDGLWSLMLAAPFNAALLCMLVAIVMNLRSKKTHAAMPDLLESDDKVRIKLHPGPVATAISAFIIATIGGLVVSTFCLCAGMTALVTMILAWIAVITLTVLAYFNVIRLTTNGRYDITLNLAHKTMTVPPSSTNSEHFVIPFMDIVSVHVNESTDIEGQTLYQAVLYWRDTTGELRNAILKVTADKATAEALVACIQADVTRDRQTGTNTLRGQD